MSQLSNCQSDLRGSVIPLEHRAAYSGREYYSRAIVVQDLRRPEAPVVVECPDCLHRYEQT